MIMRSNSRSIESTTTFEYDDGEVFHDEEKFRRIITRFIFPKFLFDDEGRSFNQLFLQSLRLNTRIFAFWELRLYGLKPNSLDEVVIDSLNIGELNFEDARKYLEKSNLSYSDLIGKWHNYVFEKHCQYETKLKELYVKGEKIPKHFFHRD